PPGVWLCGAGLTGRRHLRGLRRRRWRRHHRLLGLNGFNRNGGAAAPQPNCQDGAHRPWEEKTYARHLAAPPASTLATDYPATLGCTTTICGAGGYPQSNCSRITALTAMSSSRYRHGNGSRAPNAARSRGGGFSRPRFARGANGNHSLIVRTTEEVGRSLTVGSLASLATISSYWASVCTDSFGFMCTTW